MIRVLIDGKKYAAGYVAGETLTQGATGYISGVDADGNFKIAHPSNAAQAALSVYFFSKAYYGEFNSDTSDAVNKIATGQPIAVYAGGDFETDKFIGFGTSTSNQYWWDGKQLSSPSMAYLTPTDSAFGGTYTALNTYAWPSTATATKGWLRLSTATQNNSTYEKYNRIWKPIQVLGNAGYAGDRRLQVRSMATIQFGNQYFSGVSTVAQG